MCDIVLNLIYFRRFFSRKAGNVNDVIAFGSWVDLFDWKFVFGDVCEVMDDGVCVVV